MSTPNTPGNPWNERYRDAGASYLFGTEPNRFLAERAALFDADSSALLVADGEGRNSVWLAQRGLTVTALDIAPIAVGKAAQLAARNQVALNLIVGDMLAPDWPPASLHGTFDWVIGIFIQFTGAEMRARQFAAMQQLTRPGGRILLQGYTPKQLEYRTGGPSALENLYTPALLQAAFTGWTIEELVDYDAELVEGAAHHGPSALIGMIARKPLTIPC
ncbi:class I SAM-dependent methyltransferase [Actimicrobium antarcticum]|uniref:Class I SAM-dependent methyltransferase n=1 Tax=Actimicrobium antarcticum TaxID=1051899 RepID=A0ABP7SH51_9BURK